VFLGALWELDDVKWEKVMILYLKDDIKLKKSLLYKYVYKNNVINQFSALWFEIEQSVFNLKVRQQWSVISIISVLCRLFETYIHQIWVFRSVKTVKSYLTLSLMI